MSAFDPVNRDSDEREGAREQKEMVAVECKRRQLPPAVRRCNLSRPVHLAWFVARDKGARTRNEQGERNRRMQAFARSCTLGLIYMQESACASEYTVRHT